MGNRSGWPVHLREWFGTLAFEQGLAGFARLGRIHPLANPARHGVERFRDIAYRDEPHRAHLLDIYRPLGLSQRAPLPVVIYVHGGAFRAFSKETHWMMALAFARRGFLVFSINYHLAPKYPFPAAIDDVCVAYLWVQREAARWGGDADRIVVAGESAGANLVTALTIAATYERKEPFARAVFASGRVPVAVLPACGLYQVTDIERFMRRKRLAAFPADQLRLCSLGYLPDGGETALEGGLDLADVVVFLERRLSPARALPPFMSVVGTRDPLLDDARRLKAAVRALGGVCEVAVYPGELHAFHAMVWRDSARDAWSRTFRFLGAIPALRGAVRTATPETPELLLNPAFV